LVDPQPLGSDNPQTPKLAGFTPRRASVGPRKELPPRLVEVAQPPAAAPSATPQQATAARRGRQCAAVSSPVIT